MEALRGFYRKLADDEGMVQFRANHPSKLLFVCQLDGTVCHLSI
jgi:hypothetical protein